MEQSFNERRRRARILISRTDLVLALILWAAGTSVSIVLMGLVARAFWQALKFGWHLLGS